MQPILDHIDNVVRPALRDYLGAEMALNAAHDSKDPKVIYAARKAVMRVARTAAIELHQFADLVANEPTPQLPVFTDAAVARIAVKPHCVFIRTTTLIDDVHLLGDVADAFKHHKLNRRTATIYRREGRRHSRQRLWRDAFWRRKVRWCRASSCNPAERRQTRAIGYPAECVRCLDAPATTAVAAGGPVLGRCNGPMAADELEPVLN